MYEWVSKSTKRHAILVEVVKDFGHGRHEKLKLLKMYDVRWLSKGQVITRIIKIIPALLTVIKIKDK